MEINTDEFDRVNYAHIRDANNLIDRIIDENNNKYGIVMDIGCGSGNITSLLNDRLLCDKIIAVDVDMKMIKFAKTKYPSNKIDYILQDISVEWDQLSDTLKAYEGSVDLIFSNRALHWVEDKTNTANNMYRFLSPKGKFYSNITTLWDLFHDSIPEEKSKIDRLLKIPKEKEQIEIWRQSFTESGFHDIEVDFFILRQIYPNDEFKDVLLPYFPNLTKKYLIEKDPYKRNKIMNSGLKETIKNAMMRLHCRELPVGSDGKPEYELAYGQCRVVANK